MKNTLKKSLSYPFSYWKLIVNWSVWRYRAKKSRVNQKMISLSGDVTLIDVGASYFMNPNWQFALSNKENCLIAIDPNPQNLTYLEDLADCEVKSFATALSSKAEPTILYVTNEDSGSSLYKPVISTVNYHKVDSELESYLFPYEEKIIETQNLMNLVSIPAKSNSFWLKLDTQGAELDILMSGKSLLMSGLVTIVEVEGSLLFEPIMQGGCKAIDLISFMENCGFELIKLVPLNSKKRSNSFQCDRGYLNECDLVFGLRTTTFNSWEPQFKKSLFSGYISYGLVDLALRLATKDEELNLLLKAAGLNPDDKNRFINEIESIFVNI